MAPAPDNTEKFSAAYQRCTLGQRFPPGYVPPHMAQQARRMGIRCQAGTDPPSLAPCRVSDPEAGHARRGTPAGSSSGSGPLAPCSSMPEAPQLQQQADMAPSTGFGLRSLSIEPAALSRPAGMPLVHPTGSVTPGQPWSALLPIAQQIPSANRSFLGDPGLPLVHQRPLELNRIGSSCRYTSWTGEEHHAARDMELEGIDDDEEDEYGYDDASVMVKRITMTSAAVDKDGLSNPFSWKELEKSCLKLDEARVRIDQIDLTSLCDQPKEGHSKAKVLCSFQQEPCQTGTFLAGHAMMETASASSNTPISMSHEKTMSAQQSDAIMSEDSSLSGICAQGADASGAHSSTESSLAGTVQKRARMSALMRTVKERCGLLFTTSTRKRGGSQM